MLTLTTTVVTILSAAAAITVVPSETNWKCSGHAMDAATLGSWTFAQTGGAGSAYSCKDITADTTTVAAIGDLMSPSIDKNGGWISVSAYLGNDNIYRACVDSPTVWYFTGPKQTQQLHQTKCNPLGSTN